MSSYRIHNKVHALRRAVPSAYNRYRHIRTTAPVHIEWKRIKTYRAVYRSRNGIEITVRSISKPTPYRVFRSATGNRKYKLVSLKSTNREVIIMARTKNRRKAVDQEELEEIEALEDLDEDEDEDEEEEEEEDEDWK